MFSLFHAFLHSSWRLHFLSYYLFHLDAYDKIDFSDMTAIDNLYFPNNVISEIGRIE